MDKRWMKAERDMREREGESPERVVGLALVALLYLAIGTGVGWWLWG